MEVASRYYVRLLREDEGVVTATVHLDLEHVLRVEDGLNGGPVDLGDALHRVGVKHLSRVLNCLSIGQQLPHDLGHCTLPRVHTYPVDAHVEGRRMPLHRHERQGAYRLN